MSMNLAATMMLNARPFTNPLQAATGMAGGFTRRITGMIGPLAAFAGVSLSAAGAAAGLRSALNLGDRLANLSQQTDIAVGQLSILERAFENTAVGAGNVGRVFNRMQENLGGEISGRTESALAMLNVDAEELRNADPVRQLRMIGDGLGNLASQEDRVAAARGVFGRSGGEMLALLNDANNLEIAARQIGSQAEILERRSGDFSRMADQLSSIGLKVQGFFVGVADTAAPVLAPLLDRLEALDLAPVGQQVGRIFAMIGELFGREDTFQIVGDALILGFQKAFNFGVRSLSGLSEVMMEGLGQAMAVLATTEFWMGMVHAFTAAANLMASALMRNLDGPLSTFQAGFSVMLNKTMLALGIQGGDPNMTFEGEREGIRNMNARAIGGVDKSANEALEKWQKSMEELKSSGILSAEELKAKFEEGFDRNGDVFKTAEGEAQLDKVLEELSAAVNAKIASIEKEKEARDGADGSGAATAPMAAPDIQTDRLARIGGFVGGPGGTSDPNRAIARNTEKSVGILAKIEANTEGFGALEPVWN